MAHFCQELCVPPGRLLLPLFFRLLVWTVPEFGEGCPWKSTTFSGLLFFPEPHKAQLITAERIRPFLTNFSPPKTRVEAVGFNLRKDLVWKMWKLGMHWSFFAGLVPLCFGSNYLLSKKCNIFMPHVYQASPVAEDGLQELPAPICLGGRSCLQRCFGCGHSPGSHTAVFYQCWMNGLQSCVTFCALPGCSSTEFFRCP